MNLILFVFVTIFLQNGILSKWIDNLKEENMMQHDMYNQDDSFKTQEVLVADSKLIAPTYFIDYIGQIGGLKVDTNGNLVVFHRASRVWNENSFTGNNFNTKMFGKINENVLDIIDTRTGENLGTWGKNKFYMPHGLNIDHEKNIWLTDVATHQVYKYNMNNIQDEPLLTLGEKFKVGNDKDHFCKPTGVAVSQADGDIFVSDGYCNQRIVQFDKKGNFLKEFVDEITPLKVAHSIALLEKKNIICTVSREDGRIVCFDIKTGKKCHEIKHPNMNNVYAIAYDDKHDWIHAVTNSMSEQSPAYGFSFDAEEKEFGTLISMWTANDFTHTHDIALSPDYSRIYVGQLDGKIDEIKIL